MSFVHLNLRSQYSFLRGAIRIKQLSQALIDAGYQSCAITDSGNMHGALDFYHALHKQNLKPIIGIELHCATASQHSAACIFLCRDYVGYQNLIQLVSHGYMDGITTAGAQVNLDLIERFHQGLTCISSYDSGLVTQAMQSGQLTPDLQRITQIFEGNFYAEIRQHFAHRAAEYPQLHTTEAQHNAQLTAFCQQDSIQLVGTNNCHYLAENEGYSQYILWLMGKKQHVSDKEFIDYQLYLKTATEMQEAWQNLPQSALENTVKIADSCNLEIKSRSMLLPGIDNENIKEDFTKQAQQGLNKRIEQLTQQYAVPKTELDDFIKQYQQRLDRELELIVKMNFSGYFLIVADFIAWSKQNGIRVGPGRGSGPGSLVAYALEITDVDPIQHKLFFERFLNSERISMPDFDVDFDVEGRAKVIDYVRRKYGAAKVCHISSFGSLGAKAVVRGVARVLGLGYAKGDEVSRLIPNAPDITLDDAIKKEKELKAIVEGSDDDPRKKLINHARALEGLNSNLTTHAAGIIIMDQDVHAVIPVCRAEADEPLQTMYDMHWVEHQGGIKFDFLGLQNLSTIKETLRIINANQTIDQDFIDDVALDDKATYAMLSRGEGLGVFQMESDGIRRMMMRLRPERFEDIVATIALYRPGPLDNKMHIDYINRKHGIVTEYGYIHPKLEPVLKDTYGVLIFQEQVLEAVQILANYSLGEADVMRRVISKKIESEMAQQRNKFVEGCTHNDINGEEANGIFDKIEKFAGYGFNRSHSVAYGIIAYQTAYLKANYPRQFMATLLTQASNNTTKISTISAECRRMGIGILAPHINHSQANFIVEDDGIRFGMNAVRNLGQAAADSIYEARQHTEQKKFNTLEDFIEKADFTKLNKRGIEALIDAGALDNLSFNRATLLKNLDTLTSLGQQWHKERSRSEVSLFAAQQLSLTENIKECSDYSYAEKLRREKEALGIYVSGHPLDDYQQETEYFAVSTVTAINQTIEVDLCMAGMVGALSVRPSRNGKTAFFQLEDKQGTIPALAYNDNYEKISNKLSCGAPVLVWGRLKNKDNQREISVKDVISGDELRSNKATRIKLILADELSKEQLTILRSELARSKGEIDTFAVVNLENSRVLINLGVAINPRLELFEALKKNIGGLTIVIDYPDDLSPQDIFSSGASAENIPNYS